MNNYPMVVIDALFLVGLVLLFYPYHGMAGAGGVLVGGAAYAAWTRDA